MTTYEHYTSFDSLHSLWTPWRWNHFFYGCGTVLTDYVYRDNIITIKENAFTLHVLQQGKPEVAIEFLTGAVSLDKERLNSIPVEDLS